MREWAAAWGLPDAEAVSKSDFDRAYLDAALRAGKAGTGLFALRLQYDYLNLLSETLDRLYPGLPSDTHRFEQAFGPGVYLHLTAQIGGAGRVLVKAEQSGLWHLNADGTDFERLGAPGSPLMIFNPSIGKSSPSNAPIAPGSRGSTVIESAPSACLMKRSPRIPPRR